MSLFDKICAVPGALLAVVFILLGAFGLFLGCRAHFTLPPILGVLPAFAGWGILKSVLVAWRVTPRGKARTAPRGGSCSEAGGWEGESA